MIGTSVLRQALATLRFHRMRSVLTMFGISWGTASLVFLLSWGEGLAGMLEDAFTRVGKNVGMAWAGRVGQQYTPAVDRRYLWFTRQDAEAVDDRARLALQVGVEAMSWDVISSGQKTFRMDVRGVEPENLGIRGLRVGAGRPLSPFDLEGRRRVAVLGADARDKVLGPRGGVGDRIRVNGDSYEVVGVLQRIGTQLFRDRSEVDDQIWVPVTTLLARGPRYGTDAEIVELILFRFQSRQTYAAAKREVHSILAERLGVSADDREAIYIVSPLDLLSRLPLDQIVGVLFVLASTTLVIGGVGVVNMMLDSVHHRRSEIGLRLAIGGRRRDILLQFFAETLLITGIGGLAGIALGGLACLGLASLETTDLIPLPVLEPGFVIVALLAMAIVGGLAGVWPAWRAARVDPAETLRSQ